MSTDITAHDDRTRRCPMLGHDLKFSYCRAPGRELPCGRIADCWWELFDVESFLRRHYGQDEIRRILQPPTDKVTSIVDLIRKAQQAAGGE